MTPAEYIQLKAFARIDGAQLALLWTGSFACYVVGLSNAAWAWVAVMLAVITPFFMARRLRRFRDEARQGIISLRRGWAFVVFSFFYGGVLFALVQYGYLAYIDKGYLLQTLAGALASPEAEQMMSQYGMGEAMSQSLHELQAMRPIDVALNVLTTNILAGIVLGLPIAALTRHTVSSTPGGGASA